MIKKLTLFFSLFFAGIGAQGADNPLPNFHLSVGKSHYITVKGTDDGRLSVLLWQLGTPASLPGQIRTMLKLQDNNADMVEFIMPVAACKFAKTYIMRCDDSKLNVADMKSREIVLRVASQGAKEVARFTGAQLDDGGLRINFEGNLVTSEYLLPEGGTKTASSLSFNTYLWIYLNDTQNGWAGINDLEFSIR
jgi:hypothetical protein